MKTNCKCIRNWLAATVLGAVVATAQIPMGPFTAEVPVTVTPWESSIELPKFDPSNGYLLGVELELNGQVAGTATLSNRGKSFVSGTARVAANIVIYSESGVALAELNPEVSQRVLLMGLQTVSLDQSTLFASSSTVHTFLEGVDDLTPFIGTGSLSLPVEASGACGFRGSGNFKAVFCTLASAGASITYIYEPPTSFETSLQGYVWCDADFNGEIGVGEAGLADWEVSLVDVEFDEVVQTVRTESDGEYLFLGVTSGREYRIDVTPLPGVAAVYDWDGILTPHSVVVIADEVATTSYNFGYACQVEEPEYQGCTPGYWKNHTSAWSVTGYSTSTLVGDVFVGSLYSGSTLGQAIEFGGGSGVAGAQKILLRASVAALLNAADPAVMYPLTVSEVVELVNTALASGNRDVILTLATDLDEMNNAGCPKN